MNALWNKKNLERPANNIWITNRKVIDLKRFVSALETVIKDLGSQNALHMEAAILSRLIYRMKSKFRSDKGLKNMEKVNRALLNYLEIELLNEYKNLRNYIEPNGVVVNLPTKQMLQYVLVRTQGFAKLLCRIENVAKCAAEFFKARITIGHAWTVSVIAYAVISRVWFLSRYLLKRSCAWYNSIFEHAVTFRQIGPVWLPENYVLPENLKSWLDLPWIDRTLDSVPLKDDGKETIFSLIKAQINDPCELNVEEEDINSSLKPGDESFNDVLEVSKINEEISKDGTELSKEKKHEVSFFTDDIGMAIDRRTFQLNLRTNVLNSQEPIESEKNLEREEEIVLTPQTIPQNCESRILAKLEGKKSRVPEVEDDSLPVPIKKRKKLSPTDTKTIEEPYNLVEINLTARKKAKKYTDRKEPKITKDKTMVKMSKSKLIKSDKNLTKINIALSSPQRKKKHSTPRDIKTRDDLMIFLNKDSYPGLDRLQWNMLTNSIKRLVTKLEKCGASDEKRQRILLKKVNCQIQNWIQ